VGCGLWHAPRVVDTVFVFAAGDPVPPDGLDGLPAPDRVVAADGGLVEAQRFGLRVDVVVGDLDSAPPDAVRRAERDGAEVRPYPTEKDATDLELALATAAEDRPARIVVLGGHGGRLDHLLGNALVLAAPAWAGVDADGIGVQARWGPARVTTIRRRESIEGTAGSLVSLLPVGGPATGVVTEGLRYPLRGETLAPGTTRGISNELAETHAVVSVATGVLLAVQPHEPPETA
jgi:thiamine pyrophosphokinase